MKIGVIGLGVIAPYFLRAIDADPDLHLTAVCDLDQAKIDSVTVGAADPPTAYIDYHDLLADSDVEAVVVTLPNDLHARVVADALRAGLPVCCEKPLTVATADARDLAALAASTGGTLFTAFHRRYNSHVRALAAALPPRAEIERVEARYHERIEQHTGGDRWYLDVDRCGGGCVIDNGPNALDALVTVLGELTVVDATIGDVRAGVEFCAEADLVTADGIGVHLALDWALPDGEVKDITVHLKDGRTVDADMLAGYDGFKSSLDHEYRGIMSAFAAAVADGPAYRDRGPDIVALVSDIYAKARPKEHRLRMPAKATAPATIVKLLFHKRTDRGMRYSPWRTRCISAGEVHELVTTTDRPAREGDVVNTAGFLGFAEFHTATVLGRGDQLWFDDRLVGVVAGFDECHAPNHYNILVDVDRLVSAEDLDLRTGSTIEFKESA